jgi:predicted dehydrogenase
MIKLGVVGCGDVAFRTYFPGLAQLAGGAAVVACFDPVAERAERASGLFPESRAYTSYEALLSHAELDAVINLTPAPFHYDVNVAALESGLHVFSEKPLAATVERSQALIELARRKNRTLFCAPAIIATERFRWLRDVLADGRIGRPVLATAQMATLGPAAWRQYTGDPTVFYSEQVGPLLDIGVYALHMITGLLGPARRVQAFGGITIPQRTVLAGPLAGRTIDVTANDLMMLHLEFGGNQWAQVLSSFAISASKAPIMELHGTAGSISMSLEHWFDPNGPISVFHRDDSPLNLSGWIEVAPPMVSPFASTIAYGPAHFVACLQGEEQPILTAEHACHVLEIILKASDSVRDGRAIDLETTF